MVSPSLLLLYLVRFRRKYWQQFCLVLGSQTTSEAPSFNYVVVMMIVRSAVYVSAGFVGWQDDGSDVLDAIDDESISHEIVRLGKARSWAAEVRLGSGFRWRRRIGDGRGRRSDSGGILWLVIQLDCLPCCYRR